MKAIATIVDTVTNQGCTVEDDFEDADHALFMWTEGNYACDCNRRLFMARAGVPGYHKDNPTPCGDKVRLVYLTADGADLLEGSRQ